MIALPGAALAEAALLAEVAAPKCNVRSLGVLYGLCIGLIDTGDTAAWTRVNSALRAARGGDPRFADRVKRVGWEYHEALVRQIAARVSA